MQKLFLVAAALLLVACAPTSVCHGAYLEYQTGKCCLDVNHNGICDQDENVTPQAAQQVVANQQGIDRLKAAAENATPQNTSAYDVINTAFPNSCFFFQASGGEILPNGSSIDAAYRWQPFPGAQCNTEQDCTDWVNTFYIAMMEKAGGSKVQAEQAAQDLLKNGVKCQ